MTRLDLPAFLPFRLNRLAAEVSRRLSAVYAEQFGLDIPQWRVLATLADGAELTAQDIVASTRTHKSTVSRAVQELTERGLLTRAPRPQDGRAFALRLTSEGEALMQRIIPLALAHERDVLSAVEPSDRRHLLAGIAAMELALGLSGRTDPDSSEAG